MTLSNNDYLISRVSFETQVLYREISITLDSKREVWVVLWRRLTHGDTVLEMCADSTLCEYISGIHGDSHIVVADGEGARSVFLVYWTMYV